MSAEHKPDEFLEKAIGIDALFEELNMPIASLGETVTKQHIKIVSGTTPPKSHEQQAAEYFGQSLFPTPLRSAS